MEFVTNIWQALLGMFIEVGAAVGGFLWTYGPDLIMIVVIIVLAFLVGWIKEL